MSARSVMRGVGLSLVALGALCIVFAPSVASAAGSDSATPYSVTAEGITLAPGDVFADGDHVNIRYQAEGVGLSDGVHFEAKCIEREDAECAGERHAIAQYIGQSFLPLSVFDYGTFACVEWVQISKYPEHYGEGGQPPVGPGCSTPTPTPTPTETVTPTPTPTPTETVTPTPTPTPTVTPSPTPTPEPTATPTSTPVPTPEPSVTPSTPPVETPAPTVAPSPTSTAPVAATGRTAPPVSELAKTGTRVAFFGPLLGGLLVALGAACVLLTLLWRRKQDTDAS